MERWKTMLTSNGKNLGEINIKRGIFQGDSSSLLLFVFAIIPLSMLLKGKILDISLARKRKSLITYFS